MYIQQTIYHQRLPKRIVNQKTCGFFSWRPWCLLNSKIQIIQFVLLRETGPISGCYRLACLEQFAHLPPPRQKKTWRKQRLLSKNWWHSTCQETSLPTKTVFSFAKNKHHFFNANKTPSPIYPFSNHPFSFPLLLLSRLPPLQVSSCWRHSKSNCFVPNCTNCTDSSLTDSSLPSVSLAALTLPSGERLGPSAVRSIATDPEGTVAFGKRWKTSSFWAKPPIQSRSRVAVSQMLQQNVSLASRDWQLKWC